MNKPKLILIAVCCAVFMICIDFTAANIALVTIQKEFRVGISEIQWILNGYFLVFAALMVTGGRIGDLYGRKKTFLAGTAVFGIASLACGLSPGVWWVIGWRVVQGVGGALMWPSASVIAFNCYPSEKRGAIVGVIMGTAGVAQAAGPLLGGILTRELDWRWIFFINVPLSLLTVVFVARFVPEKKCAEEGERIDSPGIVALTVALVCLILALDNANRWGWGSADFLGMTAGALAAGAAFWAIENRVRSPLIPSEFFRNGEITAVLAARMLVCSGWFTMIFILGLYYQSVKGMDPFRSGLCFLPLSLTYGLISPYGGRIIDRFGFRRPVLAGLVSYIVAFGLFALVTVSTPGWFLILPSLFFGLGCALFSPGMISEILEITPEEKHGTASGVYYMLTLVGGTLGIAVTGYLLGREGGNRLLGYLASTDLRLDAGQVSALRGLLSGTEAARAQLQGLAGPARETVLAAASRAFVDIFRSSAWISLACTAAALLLVLSVRKRKHRGRT